MQLPRSSSVLSPSHSSGNHHTTQAPLLHGLDESATEAPEILFGEEKFRVYALATRTSQTRSRVRSALTGRQKKLTERV